MDLLIVLKYLLAVSLWMRVAALHGTALYMCIGSCKPYPPQQHNPSISLSHAMHKRIKYASVKDVDGCY